MKAILVLLLLSLLALAATTYKSPAFVVESQELYCTDYLGSAITTKPIGGILTVDYATNYCGFTKAIAETKRQRYLQQKQVRDNNNNGIWVLIITAIGAFIMMVTIIWW